jgi:MscS family membrane protein
MFRELLLTFLFILAAILLNYLIKVLVRKKVKDTNARKHRGILIKKTFTIIIIIFFIFALLSIWGIDPNNVWIFLTSILALIAIGFFAVWSILSNILAGIIFFFTGSIKIGENITILPEKIKGKVVDITSMFVIIKTIDKDLVNIPNNMIFQRIIKKSYKN